MIQHVTLKSGVSFPSIIRGLWQLSSGHQLQDPPASLTDPILDAVRVGFHSFDCADIYTGVEELLGQVRTMPGGENLRVHTKYVPDLDRLANLEFSYTEKIIDRSLKRLQVERLDLVQFHWWNYSEPHYLEALQHLSELKKNGKIRAIGITNFDTDRVEEMIKAGFDIETIQLQASLVDKRNQRRMTALCKEHGIKQLAYGTLLGGFLSQKWLGQVEPTEISLGNRSLYKYKMMIDDWGGWERFQSLLKQLDELSRKYQVSLSLLATQAVLQAGLVDAAIVGLSPHRFAQQNQELADRPRIDARDLAMLTSWGSPLDGDVYELERGGKHAKLMRYNLND